MLTLLTKALNQSIILLFSKLYIQAEIVIAKVSNNYYWYTRDKSVLEIKNVKETVGKMGTGVFWYLGDVQGAGCSRVLHRNKYNHGVKGQSLLRSDFEVCCGSLPDCDFCGCWSHAAVSCLDRRCAKRQCRVMQESSLPDGEISSIFKGRLPMTRGFLTKALSPVSHSSSYPSWGRRAWTYGHWYWTMITPGSIPYQDFWKPYFSKTL